MESVIAPGITVGTVGILLILLIRTYWRQGSSWERIVGAERDAAQAAREDAAAARAEVEELRKRSEAAERRCKEEIEVLRKESNALRRRVAQLEGKST
jgi:cell division protein FtsB